MSERFLIYGCGDLAWAQRDSSPFGEDWITGRLSELLPLKEGGPLTVSLGDELDGQTGWQPLREPPQIRVEIHRGRRGPTPVLPTWEDLVARQAGHVTGQLRGSGVLVTPQTWAEVPMGRTLLRVWGRAGWRWAPLEEVLDLKFQSDARFVSAGSTWLRIREPGGSAVVPNGAEAACALEVAPRVLDITLDAVSRDLEAEWRKNEEPLSGWFARQQIVRLISEALRDGRRSVELGTPEAPLFCFSSDEAAQRFSDLAGLRATLDLPPPSAAIWWEQIAEPSFLQAPSSAAGRLSIRWEALETLLLGNPEDDGVSSPAQVRSLHTYLRFNRRPLRLIDPVMLTEALAASVDVDRSLARWEKEVAGEVKAETPAPTDELSTGESATGEPLVPEKTAADPLFAFSPDHFHIEEPHRPGHLKVWLDDRQIAPENITSVRLADNRQAYRFEGVNVPRGAIVRIDFDPI
jgi:hypothetical protein